MVARPIKVWNGSAWEDVSPLGSTDSSSVQTFTNKSMSGDSNTFTNIPGAALKAEAWTAFTPTITAGSGSFTTVSATGRWRQLGKTVEVIFHVTITTNGTAASNVQVTLPATPSQKFCGIGKEIQSTGKAFTITQVGSTAAVYFANYDNTYPGGTGYQLVGSATFEVA